MPVRWVCSKTRVHRNGIRPCLNLRPSSSIVAFKSQSICSTAKRMFPVSFTDLMTDRTRRNTPNAYFYESSRNRSSGSEQRVGSSSAPLSGRPLGRIPLRPALPGCDSHRNPRCIRCPRRSRGPGRFQCPSRGSGCLERSSRFSDPNPKHRS